MAGCMVAMSGFGVSSSMAPVGTSMPAPIAPPTMSLPAIAAQRWETRAQMSRPPLDFLDTYRTMCIAPSATFRALLEQVRSMEVTAA